MKNQFYPKYQRKNFRDFCPKVRNKWDNFFLTLRQDGHRFLHFLSHFGKKKTTKTSKLDQDSNLQRVGQKTIMLTTTLQGVPKVSRRFFRNRCGIHMSQATPTKFSMLFKHTYGKNFWKFGGHSFNYLFVHGLSVPLDQGYWRPWIGTGVLSVL